MYARVRNNARWEPFRKARAETLMPQICRTVPASHCRIRAIVAVEVPERERREGTVAFRLGGPTRQTIHR
jgi:hypothetical protein